MSRGKQPTRSSSTRPSAAPLSVASSAASFGRADILTALAIAAATLLLYAKAAQFPFLAYDDRVMVADNPMVTDGLTWRGVAWAFRTGLTGNWHPLTWISYMLDASAHGASAGGVHITNVLLHAAAAAVLFLVLVSMTGARGPSLFTAGLFAVHPLHVESVAWIAERKDVLSALLGFAALGAYARYARRPSRGRYFVVAALFALGLMAKPMLVTLPFLLLLLDIWPLGRLGAAKTEGSARSGLRALLIEKIPLFVISALSSVVTLRTQAAAGAVTKITALPMSDRIANAVVTSVLYLEKMVWPAGLSVFYPRPASWPTWQALLSALVLAAITAFVLVQLTKRPYLLVGWFWYLGTLVPVIGLVQVGMQAMADRYTYLPMVGIGIMAAWGAAGLGGNGQRNEAATQGLVGAGRGALFALVAAGALVLVLAAGATWRRLEAWKDTITLFESALAVSPDNPVAHNILGVEFGKLGRIDEAIVHLREGSRSNPSAATSVNLGFALSVKGRFTEAVVAYRDAIALDPNHARAHGNLAEVLDHEGRKSEALVEYRASLDLDPAQPALRANHAALLAEVGRLDEALAEYAEILRLTPGDPAIHKRTADLLMLAGKPREAAAQYAEAGRLNPRDPEIAALERRARAAAEGRAPSGAPQPRP